MGEEEQEEMKKKHKHRSEIKETAATGGWDRFRLHPDLRPRAPPPPHHWQREGNSPENRPTATGTRGVCVCVHVRLPYSSPPPAPREALDFGVGLINGNKGKSSAFCALSGLS